MTTRPPSVTVAIVVLCLQIVTNLFAGLIIVSEIVGRWDHNQKVRFETHLSGWGSVVVAVVLAASIVFLARRVSMARLPVALIEGMVIVVGLVNLVAGAPQAIIGIGLGVVVLVCLFNRRTDDWYSMVRAG